MRPVGQNFTRRQRRLIETLVSVAVITAVIAAFTLVALRSDSNRVPTSPSAPQIEIAPQMNPAPPAGYTIKGNISVATGDKIYHVPGSEDYEATKIDLAQGEQWFRSEEEALASGWRKAPR